MTLKSPQYSNSVVSGTLLICEHIFKVLFDLGSTHYFASPKVAMRLGVEPKALEFDLIVTTLTSGSEVGDVVYPGCRVYIEENQLLVDLICLDLRVLT